MVSSGVPPKRLSKRFLKKYTSIRQGIVIDHYIFLVTAQKIVPPSPQYWIRKQMRRHQTSSQRRANIEHSTAILNNSAWIVIHLPIQEQLQQHALSQCNQRISVCHFQIQALFSQGKLLIQPQYRGQWRSQGGHQGPGPSPKFFKFDVEMQAFFD